MYSNLQLDGITDYFGDIRDRHIVQRIVSDSKAEVIFHLAAQPLVRQSYKEPIETYATNVMGTAHVLEAARSSKSVQAIVVVTSDKVYANDNNGRSFIESDKLGGHDPYSNSKACCELLVQCYRESFLPETPLITARAGNVIGGGDWSTDRLVPDLVRAVRSGKKIELRYPLAVRPWQHVLEPLRGYLRVAQKMMEGTDALPASLNFGPDSGSFLSVKEVVSCLGQEFEGFQGFKELQTSQLFEAKLLTLCSETAENFLGWHPVLGVHEGIKWTANWYKKYLNGDDVSKFTTKQIAEYAEMI